MSNMQHLLTELHTNASQNKTNNTNIGEFIHIEMKRGGWGGWGGWRGPASAYEHPRLHLLPALCLSAGQVACQGVSVIYLSSLSAPTGPLLTPHPPSLPPHRPPVSLISPPLFFFLLPSQPLCPSGSPLSLLCLFFFFLCRRRC